MEDRQLKTKVALFACVIGSILASGCATNQTGLSLSDKKVCVIDLKSEPGRQVLLDGAPQTFGMRSGRVYLQQGESIGRHNTKGNEELLVFLSGKGGALIGEEENAFEVGQGKVCYIPPNTIHNIKNTSAVPLIYIYCVAPAR
jgi:oxalate decarboxylase/phosphoglucose isomerase-like protein (cupin superfamily)